MYMPSTCNFDNAHPEANIKERPASCTPRASSAGQFALVVMGSALFWLWDYTCLATTLLISGPNTQLAGIADAVFLVAQLAMLLAALSMRASERIRSFLTTRAAIIGSSCVLCLFSAVRMAWDQQSLALGVPLVVMAFVAGVAVLPLAVAWGAQQTLCHRAMSVVIASSFLLVHLLMIPAMAFAEVARFLVAPLPLVSAALWLLERRLAGSGDQGVQSANGMSDRPDEPGELGELGKADKPGDRSRLVEPNGRGGHSGQDDMRDGDIHLGTLPWPSLLAMAILCTVSEFVAYLVSLLPGDQVSSMSWSSLLNAAFCAAILVVAAWACRAHKEQPRWERLSYLLIPLVIACLLVPEILGSASQGVLSMLLHSVTLIMQVVLWMLVAVATERDGLSPASSFALAIATISSITLLASVAGRLVASFGELSASALATTEIGCALVLVAALAALGFLAEKGIGVSRPEPQGGTAASGLNAAGSAGRNGTGDEDTYLDAAFAWREALDTRIKAFSQLYGLSPREAEVFTHLLRGSTAPHIGEELVLTTGTVKTHISHIYHKLGVNTRQQAVDLFDEFGRTGGAK